MRSEALRQLKLIPLKLAMFPTKPGKEKTETALFTFYFLNEQNIS